MSVQITYTIGIKGRFFGGWKEYRVHNHVREGDWLVLSMPDGSTLTVPDIGKKWIKVYPDLMTEREKIKELRKDVAEEFLQNQPQVFDEVRQVKAVK